MGVCGKKIFFFLGFEKHKHIVMILERENVQISLIPNQEIILQHFKNKTS